MNRQQILFFSILLFATISTTSSAWAISAKTLPEGTLRARVYQNFTWADETFSVNANREPLGNVGLVALADNGVPASQATVYSIDNQAKYRLKRTDLTLDYGLSSGLNIGVWIPYFRHDTQQTTTLTQGASWGALAAAQQTAIRGAVSTLDGTDPAHSGIGDIYLGFKKQMVGKNEDRFRFSMGGGVTLPTGDVADPLDVDDISTGDGQWDLGLWTWTDYQFTDDFFVNFHTRHNYGLAAHRQALITGSSTQAQRMRFQPGLLHHFQLEPQYRIPYGKVDILPSLMVTYDRQERASQQLYDAGVGAFTGSLQKTAGTNWQRVMVKPSLGVRLFRFELPIALYLSYGDTVWAKDAAALKTVEFRMDYFVKDFGF